MCLTLPIKQQTFFWTHLHSGVDFIFIIDYNHIINYKIVLLDKNGMLVIRHSEAKSTPQAGFQARLSKRKNQGPGLGVWNPGLGEPFVPAPQTSRFKYFLDQKSFETEIFRFQMAICFDPR